MTASDLERTLAEARAAAARRLQSLRRADEQPQQAEPAIFAQREPAPSMREPAQAFPQVPPEQVVRIDSPPVVDLRVARVATAPEPSISHPRPPGPVQHAGGEYADGQTVGRQNPIEASYSPSPPAGYVPVDPIPRSQDRTAAPPLQYAEAPDYAEPREYAETASANAPGEPSLMARLLAGVAAFRLSRAERRALAKPETAPVEARTQALTAKERRWERRRKRYFYEEILGWILVPIIIVAIYFFALWVLELSGISPDVLVEGIQTIWSQFR